MEGAVLLKYNQLSNFKQRNHIFKITLWQRTEKLCVLEVGGNVDVMRVDQGG